MQVRIVKAVSSPAGASALLSFLRGFAQDFLRKQAGNRGVWIKVDSVFPSKFFVQTNWESPENLAALFENEKYKTYVNALNELIEERLQIWDTSLIMANPSKVSLKEGQEVWIRFIKLAVLPEQVEQSYALFNEVAIKTMAPLPGFVHLQLLHDEENPLTVFIESWWDSQEALESMVENSKLKDVRAESVSLLEARMEFWMLKLVEDDPIYAVLPARVA